MVKTILAEGVWCHECEFFEVPDFGEFSGEAHCNACGCSKSKHVDVEVITASTEA